MNTGEVILHLLGGAGGEYAARKSTQQQAELQAKENVLARGHERQMQGSEHDYGRGEGAATRTSQEGIVKTQTDSAQTIAAARDATDRYLGELSAGEQRFATEMSRLSTTDTIAGNERMNMANIVSGEKINERQVSSRETADRRKEMLDNYVAFENMRIGAAMTADRLSPETVKELLAQQFDRQMAFSLEMGYSEKEFRAAWIKVNPRSMVVTPATKEGGDWFKTRYETYNSQIQNEDPAMQAAYTSTLEYDVYTTAQAFGDTKLTNWAATLHKKRTGEDMDKFLARGVEAEQKLIARKATGGGGGGSWIEQRGLPQHGAGLMKYMFMLPQAGMQALGGDMAAARGSMDYLGAYNYKGKNRSPMDLAVAASRAKQNGTTLHDELDKMDMEEVGLPAPVPSSSNTTAAYDSLLTPPTR